MEEYKPKVFENRVLWMVFEPQREKQEKNEENYTLRSFIIYIRH
jgi:hypothetical protein